MKNLFKIGVCEIEQLITTRHATSTSYTRSCIKRISEKEKAVQAWHWFDAERAINLAEAADKKIEEGKTGPLHGLPFGIKDIFDVKGIPTGMGSPLFEGNNVQITARVVEKLEAAGAWVMGKTVTAEFAFLTPGKTRNPWNPAHTPGGSSSGSAAAVAAGFVPAALGTQTNGFIIRPAAFCGVVGYKPSQGTISNHGTLDYSPTLDQTGVFTRSVADAAWVTSCIAETQNPVCREIGALAKNPKLAAVRSPVWMSSEEAQRRIFADNVKKLSAAGAEVVNTELPAVFTQAHPCLRRIMAYEAARFFRELQARGRQKISTILNAFLDEGSAISDSVYQ
ncbi:MAG: amidase, partial [Burkholderiales bacterium]